jgi:hypothetical protein
MAAENPTFQIPRDVIEPIIQAHVSAAVAQALGGRDQLVSKTVEMIVNAQVEADGKLARYDDSRNKRWLDWAMGDVVRSVIMKALQDEMAKHKVQLTEIVAKELARKNSPLIKQMAAAMVGGFANEETLKYRLTVNVESARN